MRRASSLRRRHLISRSTGETDIAQQSELDEQTVAFTAHCCSRNDAGPTPRQGPMLPDEQTLRELAAPQFDVLTSHGLVAHKVTTISYARPHSGAPTARGRLVDAMRAGEQSVARGVNVDLVFLSGALATALLVAGGAFQSHWSNPADPEGTSALPDSGSAGRRRRAAKNLYTIGSISPAPFRQHAAAGYGERSAAKGPVISHRAWPAACWPPSPIPFSLNSVGRERWSSGVGSDRCGAGELPGHRQGAALNDQQFSPRGRPRGRFSLLIENHPCSSGDPNLDDRAGASAQGSRR